MKKKNFICILIALLWMSILCGFSGERTKIHDEAGLFSAEEAELLNEQALQIIQNIQADVAIVTTDNTGSKNTWQYAEWAYEHFEVGYGENNAGVLLLLDMDNREFYIDEYRRNEEGFQISYEERETMLDHIYPYMVQGDYAGACGVFLEDLPVYMTNEQGGDEDYKDAVNSPDNGYSPSDEKKSIGQVLLSSFLPAVILSAVLVGILVIMQNRKTKASGAVYLRNGRASLRQKNDYYTHTTTTKTKIQRDNEGSRSGGHGGGGGGGSHHSGGGHSGGGRSF